MAEQKKKRKSIADDLKELRAMTEASRRRQKGENVTSDQVMQERQTNNIGQSSKPSDKRKYVSPQGKEYAGPGYGSESTPKAKPAAAKPKPAAAKSKSKPSPTQTRQNVTPSKPKPKPESKTVSRKQVVETYGNVPEVKPTKRKPKPKRSGYTRMWER